MSYPHPRPFVAQTQFGFSSGMIAYVALPVRSAVIQCSHLFPQLRGVQSWEIDSQRSVYFLLEPWMTSRRIHELYNALRGMYGAHIRFGAGSQKTTARAAALYRPVPHCTIVTANNTDAFLAELPIRLLPGLGERTTRFLEAHGIRTFTAFRRVPTATLKEWFGVSGLILQQFARGLDPRAVEPRSMAYASAG